MVPPHPSKRYVHPKPSTVTLFGKRIFADVIRLKILRTDHPGLEWALKPNTSVLKREKKGRRHRGH